jgi:ABC-type phosphate/phosphonate transport system substrate-binding protein
MYDWPEVAWAHDALWAATAERLDKAGLAAPASLERSRSLEEVWRDPDLVLSQTCGFPFATRLRGRVRLVATPAYAVEGCEGPRYSSMIVARRDEAGSRLADFAGRRVAFNTQDSLSGYVALVASMRDEGLAPDAFEWIATGSHRASIRAVAEERADVAAIDAVCWALALRHEPQATAALQIVATTPLRPGLPLITAAERSDREVAAIRAALVHAIAAPATTAAREALMINGLGVLDEWDYVPIAALGRPMR